MLDTKVLLFLDFFMALFEANICEIPENLNDNTVEFRCFPFKQIPRNVRCFNCFQSTQARAHLKDPSDIDTKT